MISNTPLQVGAYKLHVPSLLQMYLILEPLRDLMKIFTSWSSELIKLVATRGCDLFSNEMIVHFNVLDPFMED